MYLNNYYVYRVAQFIILHLRKKTMYRIAEFLAWLHCRISKKDREAVVNNLKAVVVGKSEQEIQELSVEVFKNFGRYLVDFFRSEEVDKDYVKKHVKLEGFHNLDEAFKKGNGVIATTAHICNWELSGIATAVLGYPVSIVAMVHKDKKTNDLFNGKRENKGIKIIPLGRAVRECMRALGNNRMVALVGDREFGRGGIVVDFLGRKAVIPEGPAFISLKTNAPIIPAFIMREKNSDNFRFVYESFIEPVHTGDIRKDIVNLTNRYVSVIERYIRKYPEQWLMFRRFWV